MRTTTAEVTHSLASFHRFIKSEVQSGCGIVRLDAAATFIRRAACARVARRVAREWVWRQRCPRRLEWSYRDSPELWQQYVSTVPTQPVYALPPLQATASSLRVVGGHFGTSTSCKACQPGEKAHRAQRRNRRRVRSGGSSRNAGESATIFVDALFATAKRWNQAQ